MNALNKLALIADSDRGEAFAGMCVECGRAMRKKGYGKAFGMVASQTSTVCNTCWARRYRRSRRPSRVVFPMCVVCGQSMEGAACRVSGLVHEL